ncbi:hypothetical protein [Streptomyces hoynatensis]|uniref:Uncharacterized protein n=1 Tax=Streptomyces hoynatensis TaxID=1141874 RepID=A0A3A9YSQ0_9ACTN|nr:hypothetical protein [Streptomyces hoynatensis]RKN38514.1 hypothetical protein D7294_23850 [Streptomyces hoynatensis]
MARRTGPRQGALRLTHANQRRGAARFRERPDPPPIRRATGRRLHRLGLLRSAGVRAGRRRPAPYEVAVPALSPAGRKALGRLTGGAPAARRRLRASRAERPVPARGAGGEWLITDKRGRVLVQVRGESRERALAAARRIPAVRLAEAREGGLGSRPRHTTDLAWSPAPRLGPAARGSGTGRGW